MKSKNKRQLWMFPDERTCNAEIVRFIASHNIVKTNYTQFFCDRENTDIQFYEMDDPGDWYGSMMGVVFETSDGLSVQFGSWFDEEYYREEGEYIQRILDAFTLLTPPDQKLG